MARTHALYRFFDTDGELLYVGITMNPSARWPKHKAGKEWWAEVETITLETFASRDEALDAECDAIKTERPRHNVVHASPRPEPGMASDFIAWRCVACRFRVADNEGALGAYQCTQRCDGSELPEPHVHWWPLHHNCEDDEIGPFYALDVAMLRSSCSMLTVTSHLHSKQWFALSNWDRVISTAFELMQDQEVFV